MCPTIIKRDESLCDDHRERKKSKVCTRDSLDWVHSAHSLSLIVTDKPTKTHWLGIHLPTRMGQMASKRHTKQRFYINFILFSFRFSLLDFVTQSFQIQLSVASFVRFFFSFDILYIRYNSDPMSIWLVSFGSFILVISQCSGTRTIELKLFRISTTHSIHTISFFIRQSVHQFSCFVFYYFVSVVKLQTTYHMLDEHNAMCCRPQARASLRVLKKSTRNTENN